MARAVRTWMVHAVAFCRSATRARPLIAITLSRRPELHVDPLGADQRPGVGRLARQHLPEGVAGVLVAALPLEVEAPENHRVVRHLGGKTESIEHRA